MRLFFLAVAISEAWQAVQAKGPFLLKVNDTEHIIGNDLWNITIGQTYGTKLYYKDHDCVGEAVGHYASYSTTNLHAFASWLLTLADGATSNLNWTSVSITKETRDYLDICFTANEGDLHWVVYNDMAGAYQYSVNRALPVLVKRCSVLITLLSPTEKTNIKDGPLPTLAEIDAGTKVQDETWLTADGTYITK
jgi:rhamnogalacturonan endolyase